MIARPAAVIWSLLVLATAALGQALDPRLPGTWVETETSVAGIFALQSHPQATGGKSSHLRWQRDTVVVPTVIAADVKQPRVFLRYLRRDAAPAQVRISLGPETTKAVTDPGVWTLGDLTCNPHPSGKPRWQWVSVDVPREIAAGRYRVIVQTRDDQSAVDPDVLGIVDRATHERWAPPQEVADGRLVGAGGPGPVVRVDRVSIRSPLRLVYGEDLIGPGKKPLIVDAAVANTTAQPVDTPTLVSFITEKGTVHTAAGPRVALKGGESRTIEVPVTPPAYGWFELKITAGEAADAHSDTLILGVVHRPVEGVRPDSMFGLNILFTEQDRLAAQMIGLKWRRAVPIPLEPKDVAPKPGQWWTDAEVQPIREAIRKWKDSGVLSLGIVAYNTPWNIAPGRDGKPTDTWRNRPADLNVQADICYHMFKALRRDVTYWEIWNEPWVAGWTWQTGTAQDYREMSRLIWEKVKPEMPEIMLIAGGSTSYQRDILLAPGNPDIGYADGVTSHPYNAPDRNMPSAAAVESTLLRKYGRSGGAAGIWATEVGTPTYGLANEPEDRRKFTIGRVVAPIYLLNRIGAGDMPIRIFYFQCNWGQEAGFHNLWDGADPLPGLVAFSAMTHFLEDGKLQEDLYAKSTALWAPLFTRPDGSSVIAFWADDGYSGRMELPAGVFEAYDHLGASIAPTNGTLLIDFDRWGAVYLVSKKAVDEVKAAMAAAKFSNFNALRVNPRSFDRPLEKLPPLRVKVQNLLPHPADGSISVTAPPEIELAEKKQILSGLQSGETRVIEFPVRKATPNAVNRYKIDYAAVISGHTQAGTQVVQAAYASFGTPSVDGKLDDWQDVAPVSLLSRGGKDFTEAVLNPDKAAAILNAKSPTQTAAYKFWTRWDEKNLYLAAEVPDGTPNPLKQDDDRFVWDVDSLGVALDCLEPNPDDFFVDHPLREKCFGSEVDFEFAAAFTGGSDGKSIGLLQRLKAPGTNYQTLYPTNVPTNPPLGVMAEATVAGSYDAAEKLYRYEVAIPWTAIGPLAEQLRKLQPGQSHLGRLAFNVSDAPPGRGRTFWTQEAGDLQSGAYGFSPTWAGGSVRAGGRILTDWGFVR